MDASRLRLRADLFQPSQVAFEFDDQSPIPMALHRNDKDLQICFEFLSTTPVAGDLLAIFSVEDAAAEKLSHPKAVACIAADVGQRVARVDFKTNQLKTLHGKFVCHYIRNFPERSSLGKSGIYYIRCPAKAELIQEISEGETLAGFNAELQQMTERILAEQDAAYLLWRQNLSRSTFRLSQITCYAIRQQAELQSSSLTASYELKLREKELKIRYLEAEVDRLKKEKQVPDFGQLVRSFSQEREAANDEICRSLLMIAPRLSSQLDPSRSSSYDPDDFHSNGSDEPHEDEEPVVRGSAPGPDPIFMLAGGARPACLLPGHLFIDVNEIERSIFEDEGFGADARATVTEIAEAAEDDGGNADGNNNDDDTVDLERTETADEASDYNTDSYDADDGSYYDSPSDFDDDDVSDISGGIDPVYFPSANVRLAFGSDSTGENSPASSSSDFDTSYEVVNH